jgi:fatty-acyl-CoA synthase
VRGTMQGTPLTIGAILRHGVTWHGDAQVVTATDSGARRISYAELGGRIAQLAGALRQLGITGDQRVGTFAWNNQEHLEAYLAVPAMGAILHTVNIRLFPDQIRYIVTHAEDQALIVDGSLAEPFGRLLPELPTVRTVLVTGDADLAPLRAAGTVEVLRYDEALAAQPTEFDWPDIDEHNAAAMCYTSGTTGNPKGVAYSHRSSYLHSAATCSGNAFAIRYDDRVLPVVPMFHANAWGLPYAATMAGASQLLPDRFMTAAALVRFIEAEKPTFAGAVPTIWNDVLQYLKANPGHDLSSLTRIACGGSAVPRALLVAYQEELGIPLVQAWGMTETSPVGSVAREPVGVGGDAAWDYRATQGRLLCGVDGRIVDDAGNQLPADGKAVGELEVRGPWVTGSYYNDEDPDRFDGEWLRTGDVGTLDDRGFITLTDRAKDVIKSGGEWISSVELETTLAGHPDVLEAAVVGVPDERWQERPLATVVLREGARVSPEQLRDWLSERVAGWWLPERWSFLPEVPRTSVGKFDKKVIRRRYADGELDVVQAGGAPTP